MPVLSGAKDELEIVSIFGKCKRGEKKKKLMALNI